MALTAAQQDQVTAMRNISGAAAWTLWARLPPGTTTRDDLTAIADEALCKAVERWPDYCREHGHDQAHGEREGFLVAYVIRRVKGALLDWARSSDWLTRAERNTVKAVQAETELTGCTTEQAARRAGIDPAKARQAVEAATWKRPASLDEHLNADGSTARETLADESPDVESQAAVTGILAVAARAIAELDDTARAVITARYYEGWKLPEVAAALGLELDEVRKHWERAICLVHDALLAAAGEGCACSSGGRCACMALVRWDKVPENTLARSRLAFPQVITCPHYVEPATIQHLLFHALPLRLKYEGSR